MRVGVHVVNFSFPTIELGPMLRDVGTAADEVGLDNLSVMDHYFQLEFMGRAEDPMLEAYTTLGFLAAATRDVELQVVMTGVTYRYPGLLAKIVATLDVLSGGRAALGIGAAWYEREHLAMGVPFPPVSERFERLEETLQIVLQMWSDDDGPYDGAHYRLSLAHFGTDNPDQRLAEDFRSFVSDSLSLFFGLLSSVVSFASFVVILWTLSGPLTLDGITVPGYMVWVAIGYATVGSLVAHWVGRPLIGLNFQQERYEADFRYALVRARENAEGIALYRGEHDELKGFRERFANVDGNWWAIMKQQKRFTWFSSFYGQLAIVFPILVASPRYFSGAITLGGLTQISGAFGQVQQALSWLVDAYVRIAGWRASIERLRAVGVRLALDDFGR